LPLPLILKRFFAPDLVFNLGIWLSWTSRAADEARAAARDLCC
jgi:hypothetical protein